MESIRTFMSDVLSDRSFRRMRMSFGHSFPHGCCPRSVHQLIYRQEESRFILAQASGSYILGCCNGVFLGYPEIYRKDA